ncbi:hypothetical protein [Streptomyces sp. FH025]|uniref:hypothetical protein n=1 Tax=Streptomyces sp. FH025 TaxID=2815937 RepID=UPI001A9DCA4F|nr:hypothetical protein [Streptomyces sp. FH025]MBO1415251.1 hypothetical protein [Streptomyces sp. FH025]
MRHRTGRPAGRRGRWWAPVLFVTAAAVVGVLAEPGITPVADSYGSPAAFMSWDQLLHLQGRMNETAFALQNSPGQSADQAVAGVVAAPEAKHLTVYWHGELTPAAKAIIAQSRAPVVVKAADHTAAELSEASSRVVELAGPADVQLVNVARAQDGGGLTASVVGGEAEAARLREAVASMGVPVAVTPGGEPSVVLADPGRNNDPTAGGAQMASPICSTAFAAKVGGQAAMLTADHCFPVTYGDKRWPSATPGEGPVFGARSTPQVKLKNNAVVDVAAMSQMPGFTFEPRIWTGPAAHLPGPAQQKAWVTGAVVPQKGNWICNMGSRSGETCNLQITDRTEDYFADVEIGGHNPDGSPLTELRHFALGWQAKKRVTNADPNPFAGRRGDSGGPVVTAWSGVPGSAGPTMTAAGIVSASVGKAFRCDPSTYCFKGIQFVGIDDALRSLGASITVTASSNTAVRIDMRAEDLPVAAPGGSGGVERPDRVVLIAQNGASPSGDSDGGFHTTDPGRQGTVWDLTPELQGGYSLLNITTGRRMRPEVGGTFQIANLPNPDPNTDIVQLRGRDNRCLKAIDGFRWWMSNQMLVSGQLKMGPCDPSSPEQRFEMAPVGTGLTDPVPAPAETGDAVVPEYVDPAPDASLASAAGFLAKAHDRYAPQGLGVPQSYTGGHFAPGPEFGTTGYQASFTYDNAVIIAALLQQKNRDVARATRLGDSLLYAQAHDSVPDGRIRASYEPDPFITPATGAPYVGGFSVYTGNMAWAGMAFARLYSVTHEQRFLDGAQKVANWIQTNTADTRGLGGYTGGYVDTTGTGADMVRKDWKATEHNIDVGAFFAMLADLTGDQTWRDRSNNAFAFVRGMQADDGRLWTGTGTDGVTQNRDSVPEDVQTWSYLATLDPAFSRSVDWAAENLAASDGPYRGVSFARADTSKVWFEGTAHLLAAYHARGAAGDAAKAAVLQKSLTDAQAGAPNGDGLGIVAASSDGLKTGEGDTYYASLHTGATAWYLLAGQGANPFRL